MNTNTTQDNARMHQHAELYKKAQCLFPDDSPIPFRKVWNHRGVMMAAYAVQLMQKAPDENAAKIYAAVACEFGCTISGVVNSIRYMITTLWNKDREALCAYAGADMDKQPTVAEFLTLLFAKQRQDQKQHPEAFAEAVVPVETKKNEGTADAKRAAQEQPLQDNAERLGN